MKLVDRNYMWVRDAAYSIGEGKKGLASFMFTPNEIVSQLGLSRNTVVKYLKMMEGDGVVSEIVVHKKLSVYRFCKSYLMGITGDRLSSGGGR